MIFGPGVYTHDGVLATGSPTWIMLLEKRGKDIESYMYKYMDIRAENNGAKQIQKCWHSMVLKLSQYTGTLGNISKNHLSQLAEEPLRTSAKATIARKFYPSSLREAPPLSTQFQGPVARTRSPHFLHL